MEHSAPHQGSPTKVNAPSPSTSPATATWPLSILSSYRVLLASLALISSSSDFNFSPLGDHNLALFQTTSLVYFIFSLLAFIAVWLKKPRIQLQLYTQAIIDIAAITLLMHASGGVQSGLGVLLIVSVANSSLVMKGRMTILFAAIATLCVLFEQAYSILEGSIPASSYTQAGLLGAGFFATALLGYFLARRTRESEALAEKRGIDLANMARLTEYIIQRMQTGVIVVDHDEQIRLINEAATTLLAHTHKHTHTLSDISTELSALHKDWHKDQHQDAQQQANPSNKTFYNHKKDHELQPRFAALSPEPESGTLIFIEDTRALAQQAQQLKLASLGRLAASIAHEIRNPLSAINHASQLLSESEHLDHADLRLNEIIQTHTQRVNTIIENVMQLSRRRTPDQKLLALKPWLDDFIHEFSSAKAIPQQAITVTVEPDDLAVYFDSSQLRQLLWNLCENGWRASTEKNQDKSHTQTEATLTIRALIPANSPAAYLEILDNGSGIADDLHNSLFEPFVTSKHNGSGLGLYIVRELCEINRASISYQTSHQHGTCFRVAFADPRRQI